MGLDFAGWDDVDWKDAPRWGYLGFHRFRKKLASSVGIAIDGMVGFGGSTEWPDPCNEPLVYLLNHSDCDGDLTPQQCQAIIPRLRDILLTFDLQDWDRIQGERLVRGMEKCASQHKRLVFC